MAVWNLLLGLALIATAYGQAALRMKFNPNGLNLMWSQLGQLGFAYNFSDIQVEENGGSTTRVFSTSELQMSGYEFGVFLQSRVGEGLYRNSVLMSAADLSGQYNLLVSNDGETLLESTGRLIFNYNFSFTIEIDATIDNREQNLVYDISRCTALVNSAEIRNRDDFEDSNTANIIAFILMGDYRLQFETQLCTLMIPTLQLYLNLQTQAVPLQTEILPGVWLNTSAYVLPPVTNDGAIIAEVDGRAFLSTQIFIEFPYEREVLTEFSPTERMYQIAFGEYSLQTLIFALTEAGTFNVVIDSNDLGNLRNFVLFVNSNNNFTTLLQDRNFRLRLRVTEAPLIDMTSGIIRTSGNASLLIEVVDDSNTTIAVTSEFLVRFVAESTFFIENNLAFINVTDIQAVFEIVSSSVGPILLDPINLLFGSTENARLFLLPLISGQLANGYTLPFGLISPFSLANAGFEITKNSAVLAFDLVPPTVA